MFTFKSKKMFVKVTFVNNDYILASLKSNFSHISNYFCI